MHKAAVIGAGSIGALLDKPRGRGRILTHAHAYAGVKNIHLSAFSDIDYGKSLAAARRWGGNAYRDADKMLAAERPDIVSICVPDREHEPVLRRCLRSKHRPKILFCEKPLTLTLDASKKLFREAQKNGTSLVVNFTRRWDRDIQAAQREVRSGKWGRPVAAAAFYNKGILHNGCHAVDLLMAFLGSVKRFRALARRADCGSSDATVDAFLEFKRGGAAHLIATDFRFYSMFEADFLFEKGRIQISQQQFSLTRFEVGENPVFKGRKRLMPAQKIENCFRDNLGRAVQNLADVLDGRATFPISTEEVLENQKICEGLRWNR